MELKALSTQVLSTARERGVKIATAESCTGGLISASLTDIAGSSDVFERGFVTYSNDAKMEMLGVKASTLDTDGAVSESVAAEMAAGALTHSRAQLSLSVTGIAGPGGSEHKPEGRVCFGLSFDGKTHTQTQDFGALGRRQVRERTTQHALLWALDVLTAE